MKIKVISEGYGHNTKVINEETGEELEGVTSIEWSVSPGLLAECTLILNNVPMEIVGNKIRKYKLTNKYEKYENSSS